MALIETLNPAENLPAKEARVTLQQVSPGARLDPAEARRGVETVELPKTSRMHAAKNERYGSPDVLVYCEVERPELAPREVLVRVHHSMVTQGDRRLRAADYPGFLALFGRLFSGILRPRHAIGGTNFAGKIVAVGRDVTRFSVGDDVFGGSMHGAYAEYLAVSEDFAMARMPAALDHAAAAVLPYGGGTALVFLRDLAKLRAGERVLVVGASGGVGRMAVQIARQLGAHVTAVCAGERALMQRLGAHEVIDYRKADFTEGSERWDVVFDTTEGDHFRRVRKVLNRKGRYLTLYVTPRVLLEMALSRLFGGPRALAGVAMPSASLLEDLAALASANKLGDVIARRYPLRRTHEAHAFLEEARPHGAVLIDVIGGSAEAETGH